MWFIFETMTVLAAMPKRKPPMGKPMGVSVGRQDCRPVSRRYLQHEHDPDETDSGIATLEFIMPRLVALFRSA